MTFGFYTFGDAEIGLGHIYRCLALAREIARAFPDADLRFEADALEPGLSLLEREHPGRVRGLKPGTPPEGRWDVLVVDRLATDPAVMKALKARTRCLVSIDDTGPGHREADLAFHTLYRPAPGAASATGAAAVFAGFEYLIIDPRFVAARKPLRPAVSDLLLTQGGADTYGCVPPILERLFAWRERHPEVRLHVHVGPAFRHGAELDRVLAGRAGDATLHRSIPDMPALLARMDLAVCAGGVMPCELAAAGVPIAAITSEAQEIETIGLLEAAGCAAALGAFAPAALDRLPSLLDALLSKSPRRAMRAAAEALFDGKAGARIAEAIRSRLAHPPLAT